MKSPLRHHWGNLEPPDPRIEAFRAATRILDASTEVVPEGAEDDRLAARRSLHGGETRGEEIGGHARVVRDAPGVQELAHDLQPAGRGLAAAKVGNHPLSLPVAGPNTIE
jgi:hypothetical protein